MHLIDQHFILLLVVLIYFFVQFYKLEQNMSKNLFAKIYFTQAYNHSEQTVHKLIQSLIDKAMKQSITKQIEKMQIDILREESMNKQTYTVQQAFARNPFRTLLTQDTFILNRVKESVRPLSAKIDTVKKQQIKPTNSRRTIYRHIRTSTVKSAKSIASIFGQSRKKARFERGSFEKFVVLTDQHQNLSFQEQQYINFLREKKAKEELYQKQKQEFFRTMAEDQLKNQKLTKKFMQHMSNKNYYYTKNGELIQTSNQHIPSKILKKTITSKTQISKRQNQEHTKTDTIVVQYKQKENPFKKTSEPVFLETSKKNLFYKSDNCKYRILT